MRKLENPKEILVILSSSRALRPAINYLEEEYSVDFIDFLKPKGTTASTQNIEKKRKIWQVESQKLEVDFLDNDLKNELRSKNYDFVIILANEVGSNRYKNVEKVAQALEPTEIQYIDQKQRIRKPGIVEEVKIYFEKFQKLAIKTIKFIYIALYFVIVVIYKVPEKLFLLIYKRLFRN